MIAILHNIRSIYNVASIFRSADGLGVEKLYLSGHTPTPVDRFGRKRQKFAKVALGAEETVAWEKIDDVHQKITSLQARDLAVLACEPTRSATDYRDISPDGETCLVFGNEPAGLPEDLLITCDDVIQIPMQGEKSSLNVSVAFGVITARLIDKKS